MVIESPSTAIDISNLITNYIGIIMGAVIPVALIWYLKVTERRREKKETKIAAELKTQEIKTAADLKAHNEKTAIELKLASMDIADDLRKHLDDKIASINLSITDLGKRIDLVNGAQSEISKRVDTISANQLKTRTDQMELINDLQHRADMTNGNVENIRNDIMDVQESVEDIVDGLYELPPLNTRKQEFNSRKQERRTKRRRISYDARYQDETKHRIGEK